MKLNHILHKQASQSTFLPAGTQYLFTYLSGTIMIRNLRIKQFIYVSTYSTLLYSLEACLTVLHKTPNKSRNFSSAFTSFQSQCHLNAETRTDLQIPAMYLEINHLSHLKHRCSCSGEQTLYYKTRQPGLQLPSGLERGFHSQETGF